MTDELSFSLNYPKTTSTSRRKTLTGPRPLVASTPKKPGACPATLWRINTDLTTVTGGQTPLGQYVSAAVLAHTLCPSSVRNSGKAANAETLPFYLTTIWFVHRSCFHGLDLTDVSEHASRVWESFQASDRPGTANGWPRSVFNLQTCFMSSPVDFKFKTDSFYVSTLEEDFTSIKFQASNFWNMCEFWQHGTHTLGRRPGWSSPEASPPFLGPPPSLCVPPWCLPPSSFSFKQYLQIISKPPYWTK